MIAYCLSFTALGQIKDSTLCFTTNQVKQFLRTKVELENDLESNNILLGRLEGVEAKNLELTADLEGKSKKLKRTRAITWGAGGLALIFGTIVVLK